MEYFRKAYAARQSRNFEEAVKLVQSAIHEDPQNAQHYALAGDIYYDTQDLTEAKKAWKKAMTLNPRLEVVREKMVRLMIEKDVEEKMDEVSESIFEIRVNKDGEGKREGFSTRPEVSPQPRSNNNDSPQPRSNNNGSLRASEASREETGDEIMAYLKTAYETIGSDFDYYPRHKIVVLLYSPEDFRRVREVPDFVAGLYDGKIRIPVSSAPRDDTAELERIIRHEYTHALVFDITKGKCPLFLNEGLAEHESQKPLAISHSPLANSQKLKPYPLITIFLPENLNKKPLTLDAGRFYASSRSLVEYIIFIWEWDGMRALLRAIGSGGEWGTCVRDVFRIEPLELEKRWMGRAREKGDDR